MSQDTTVAAVPLRNHGRVAALSPARLALLERRLGKTLTDASGRTIPQRIEGREAPQSFAQQRIWLLDQITPGGCAYNIPRALTIRGDLDVSALQTAIDAVVARHEVLRSTYASSRGRPVQIILEAGPQELALIDLRELPVAARGGSQARSHC